MSEATENNARIAKNTLILYVRMLFLMLISLYTSRVNLAALGIEDFGIYNVVGGVVGMFSILTGSLSAAIGRFITFELGKGDNEKLKSVFSSAVTVQLLLSLTVILLAETAGLWFLNSQMNIAEERMNAANWVYQFSIATFVISLISVPYNATIIAHEKMSAFAYISIFEGLGKLAVAFLITVSPIDRLIFYAALLLAISVTVRLMYGQYCKKNFEECAVKLHYDKTLLKQMFGFAGWNFIGASSAVLRDQGGNILLNIFFGPAVNAARGVSQQINNAVTGFVTNFMTALNPQITKSYASGDRKYMMSLIYQGARYSYYLLLILALPIILNIDYILSIWLKEVPEHSGFFAQLTLIYAMSESISNPLITAMLATGKIKEYQIIVGGLQMLNLPLSYILLKMGTPPEAVLLVAIAISQCCLAARLIMLRKMIGLPMRTYLKKVYFNVIIVTALAFPIPVLLQNVLAAGFLQFIINCIVCVLCAGLSITFVGCSRDDRKRMLIGLNSFKEKIINR